VTVRMTLQIRPLLLIRSDKKINYQVIQKLGVGGNSEVYLVQCMDGLNQGVLFALKVFYFITDKERYKRFNTEREFLKESYHPSILQVFDEGFYDQHSTDEKFPFIVVEYLPDTLLQINQRTLLNADKINYTIQLLSVLALLDQLTPPVIHRDIKPHNIFIKGRSCVLGDFGLMKLLGSASEDEDDRKFYEQTYCSGMPRKWRTPDLVDYIRDHKELTTKTDIFQLGLVVAWLFTGKNPEKFSGGNYLKDVELKEIENIPGLSIKQTIEDLINSMLDFNPVTRPSAIELLDRWQGLFNEVIDQSHKLNGKVF